MCSEKTAARGYSRQRQQCSRGAGACAEAAESAEQRQERNPREKEAKERVQKRCNLRQRVMAGSEEIVRVSECSAVQCRE